LCCWETYLFFCYYLFCFVILIKTLDCLCSCNIILCDIISLCDLLIFKGVLHDWWNIPKCIKNGTHVFYSYIHMVWGYDWLELDVFFYFWFVYRKITTTRSYVKFKFNIHKFTARKMSRLLLKMKEYMHILWNWLYYAFTSETKLVSRVILLYFFRQLYIVGFSCSESRYIKAVPRLVKMYNISSLNHNCYLLWVKSLWHNMAATDKNKVWYKNGPLTWLFSNYLKLR